jgi:hypothetical protein
VVSKVYNFAAFPKNVNCRYSTERGLREPQNQFGGCESYICIHTENVDLLHVSHSHWAYYDIRYDYKFANYQ